MLGRYGANYRSGLLIRTGLDVDFSFGSCFVMTHNPFVSFFFSFFISIIFAKDGVGGSIRIYSPNPLLFFENKQPVC